MAALADVQLAFDYAIARSEPPETKLEASLGPCARSSPKQACKRQDRLEIARSPFDKGGMEQALAAKTDIATAIIASGIGDEPVTHLVEGAMRRLVLAGVALDRMQVGFRILHPLFDGMSITWTEAAGVEVSYYEKIDVDGSSYRLSPFYFMLANEVYELRLRIDDEATAARFPVLADLKARGFIDYLAMIVCFGGAPMTPESHQGLGTSWSTRSPSGFSTADVAAMRQVLSPLALALRVVIKDQITRNALNTFHGPLVSGRILSGLIKRGAGERLAAALWCIAISPIPPALPTRFPSKPSSICSTSISIAPPAPSWRRGPGARHHRRCDPRLLPRERT